MNKGKEPVVQQRPNPSNSRLANDDSPTSKPKKNFKINSKAEVPSPKHSPLKNAEPVFPQALPQKISLSRQSNRAQSVEKLPPPSMNDIKSKIVVITRDSGVIRQPNKPVKVQEPESKEHKASKSASPNKERVVREVPKVKENIQRKDTLEVVSEENEEHFRETLQGLKRKDSETLSKKPESPSKAGLSIIAVETIWDEYNLNKGRNIMVQKKSDEEEKSPKREKKDLVIETFKPYGESVNEPGTPTAEEIRSASQVRGKFTKEHVLPAVRQKEQDQKKLMREYLDSQMDEKRRLKEEEKLRQMEEDKKEEARLRREMEQLNKQYEKELNSSKGSRQSDARTESPLKELRTKLLVKREDSPELKKLDYSDSETKKTMKFKTLKETLKDEGLLRKDEGEKIGELSGHNNIKKLAQENEQLRNQNLRKNELIDILITALKNTGQDGPLSADQLRYTPAFSQPRAKSRTMHEKPPVPARTVENVDSPVFHKQDHLQLERNNTSPWSTAGGTYYAGLRSETDPDMTSEEPLSPISTGPQTSIRANENLSRLIGPSAYPELKLPAIPDFYSHRKGFSALVDQNNSSIKGKTFLSRSNMQTLETNASVSQSSSRMFSTPINSKISPRQFPLNINSPSNAVILKPKSEIMTTSVTPTLYSRHISQYARSKPEGSPDIDIMSMGGRSTVELDSMKVVPSLTQLSVRKEKKGNLSAAFQVPGSPFRSSANIHPRGIVDPRSPIRVVDMGSGQQSTANREKGAGNVERAEHKKSADGYAYPFMKEREPRFKDELISVRDGVKSVRSLDQYLEKGDIEMDALKNRTKFPKEVFYLNLRKKVLV